MKHPKVKLLPKSSELKTNQQVQLLLSETISLSRDLEPNVLYFGTSSDFFTSDLSFRETRQALKLFYQANTIALNDAENYHEAI